MAQVTATVKDPNGNLYTNAKVEAIFINNTGLGQLPLASGSVFPTFTVNTTDSFGVVSLGVTGNDLITPAGTQWRFSVISSTTPAVGFSTNITISGASQDISAALQAAAANLPSTFFGGVTVSSLTVPQVNHQRVIDGVTYPNTGAGLQQAVADCIADALCSDVDARLLGSVTTTTTTSLTKPMRMWLGANTIIAGTSDPVMCFGNNAIHIEGVAGEGNLGTVSVIKSTATGSRVLAPCTPTTHTLSITLRSIDLWNGAANSTAIVLDFTNVNQSRVDNCFIQQSSGGTGDLVFVTITNGLDAFYNNFIGCKLFGSGSGIGYHFTNGANSNAVIGGKIDHTSDCVLVDSTGTQTNEIGFYGTVCESQTLAVIHTIGNTTGVRWFGGRWESPAPATLFNISASSSQIEVIGVGEYNTQTCGTTNSLVTIIGWPTGSPCISSGIDIFTPTNISSQAYIGQNSGVTSTFTNSVNGNSALSITTNSTGNGNGLDLINSAASGQTFRLGSIFAVGRFSIRSISQTGQPAWSFATTNTVSAEGIHTHANTATRTYTWPDVTGSVQVNSQAPIATGSLALFTGSTGACATTGTQSGGSWVGRVTCTAATAASTLVINPGTTAPNGWVCTAFDETTRANLLQQTATTTTNCTLTATSITQNDVIVFQAIAF